MRGKRAVERRDVAGETSVVVPDDAAVVIMRVETLRLRAVADPVFYDRRDTVPRDTRAAVLEALNIGAHEC